MYDIAQNVIDRLGGFRSVAEILGLHVSRVYRFTYPKERGGTDGLIPAEHQQKLLDYAIENNKNLKAHHFFKNTTQEHCQFTSPQVDVRDKNLSVFEKLHHSEIERGAE